MKKLFISVLLAGLCACATNQTKIVPWFKDNVASGTIVQIKTPSGYTYQYKNTSGQIVRIEDRDPERSLLSIVEYEYDNNNHLTEERRYDSSEHLRAVPEGFAIRRFVYRVNPDGERVTEIHFYDAAEKPVLLGSGYGVLRQTFGTDGKLQKVHCLDTASKPIPSTWLGVGNVVEIQYSYLSGVGEVMCAVFLNSAGQVVFRKELAGGTSAFSSSSYYNNYYYAPGPYYSGSHKGGGGGGGSHAKPPPSRR